MMAMPAALNNTPFSVQKQVLQKKMDMFNQMLKTFEASKNGSGSSAAASLPDAAPKSGSASSLASRSIDQSECPDGIMAGAARWPAVDRQEINQRTPGTELATWGCGSGFNYAGELSSGGRRADSASGCWPRRTGQDRDALDRVRRVSESGLTRTSAAWALQKGTKSRLGAEKSATRLGQQTARRNFAGATAPSQVTRPGTPSQIVVHFSNGIFDWIYPSPLRVLYLVKPKAPTKNSRFHAKKL